MLLSKKTTIPSSLNIDKEWATCLLPFLIYIFRALSFNSLLAKHYPCILLLNQLIKITYDRYFCQTVAAISTHFVQSCFLEDVFADWAATPEFTALASTDVMDAVASFFICCEDF